MLAENRLRVRLIKEDFPLPDTPVTQINVPNGNVTSTFRRLFPLAPLIVMNCPFPFRRSFGTAISVFPFR